VRNPRFQRKIIFSLKQYVDGLTDGRFGNPSNPVLLVGAKRRGLLDAGGNGYR
jgi:hypothetical protein